MILMYKEYLRGSSKAEVLLRQMGFTWDDLRKIDQKAGDNLFRIGEVIGYIALGSYPTAFFVGVIGLSIKSHYPRVFDICRSIIQTFPYLFLGGLGLFYGGLLAYKPLKKLYSQILFEKSIKNKSFNNDQSQDHP